MIRERKMKMKLNMIMNMTTIAMMIMSFLLLLITVIQRFPAHDELGVCRASLFCPEQPGGRTATGKC